MVPGAAHGVADDESFGQRTAIMRTARADREQFISRSRQDHLIVTDVSEQQGAVAERCGVDPLGQVYTRCVFRLSHGTRSMSNCGAAMQSEPQAAQLASSLP
jgi:hypothetical protein